MRKYAVIRSADGTQEELINWADLYSSWERDFQLSQTYQVSVNLHYMEGYEHVFNLARQQAEIVFGGQHYTIKEVDPVADEQGKVTNKITAVNAIVDKLKNLRVAKTEDSKQSQDQSSDDNQPPGTTVTKPVQQEPTYSLDSVMSTFFNNNDQGIKYELHGNFTQQPIQAEGDCLSFLTGSLSSFGGYWIPDGNTVKIYDLPSLKHQIDVTFRYLHDTTNVEVQSSTNDVVNCVNVKAGKMEQTTTSGGGPVTKSAQGVINDARKYLGVPYVYGGAGGARGGNPMSGMDCSSYVSQVYKDFGINIPAYTVAMEPYFHEVSSAQTGDVGFYGAHGGSYHICLFIDANTIIYEPQTGEVCKEEPVSYYPPSWIARNDQMAAIVGGSSSGGDTTTDTKEFYKINFVYKDQDSINKYGLHWGEDVTLDAIYDQGQAENYLKNHLQLSPVTSFEVTYKDDASGFHLGDYLHDVTPELNINTDAVLFGLQVNDFNPHASSVLTFNNTSAAMKDVVAALWKDIHNMNPTIGNTAFNNETGGRDETHNERYQLKILTPDQMNAAKVFTEGGSQ